MKHRRIFTALIVIFLIISSAIVVVAKEHKEIKGYAKVSSRLNVREGPMLEATIIEKLLPGEIATVISTENKEWTQIVTNNGNIGYVSNEYFEISEVDSEECELVSVSIITKTDGSSENRNFNMSKACEAINNLILEPGEEYNWYGENGVGEANKENGYKEATVISNGEYVLGYGGGVCQVSTALYNCIYKLEIIPTEHHHHSKNSSYVETGMDATVAYPSKNFVFTNTKDYPIMFEAHTEGAQVIITAYKVL